VLLAPELAYLQAKFAALTSYAISAQLLAEVLPLERRLDPAVLRRQVQASTRVQEASRLRSRPIFLGCIGHRLG